MTDANFLLILVQPENFQGEYGHQVPPLQRQMLVYVWRPVPS